MQKGMNCRVVEWMKHNTLRWLGDVDWCENKTTCAIGKLSVRVPEGEKWGKNAGNGVCKGGIYRK